MSRVDFYLLESNEPRQRQLYACRLTEKAYRLGHSIYIHTASPAQTQAMDELLWTFRQGSFIPHCSSDQSDVEPVVPVVVGHGSAPARMNDLLINLNPEVVSNFASFQRIAELVDQDEPVRQAGRQRYRLYQEAGIEIKTHKVAVN